jgi:hypothetical protein
MCKSPKIESKSITPAPTSEASAAMPALHLQRGLLLMRLRKLSSLLFKHSKKKYFETIFT